MPDRLSPLLANTEYSERRAALAVRAARSVSLAGVIAAAVALAVLWVYMVPMLEASDETEHFDYVLALTHAGRLLPGRPVFNPITTATADDETRFFETYSDFYRINLNRHDRVPPGYGTHQYFQRIDRRAAARFPSHWNYWDDPQRPKPGLIDLYPFGFYGANALWLRFFSLFDRSQVALFFAARWFSVLLLAISLIFIYGVARQLRLPGSVSLALTAAIGMHSLTSFVASYVQPDNMALTLISIILFLSLRLGPGPINNRSLALLAVALGALAITKYQFFACVAVVVCIMLVAKLLAQRRSSADLLQFAAVLAVPSVVALLLQRLMVGSDSTYTKTHLASMLPAFGNLPAFFAWLGVFGGLTIRAFYHFFIGGFNSEITADPHYSGSVSYWGNSGWLDTPLTFGNSTVDTSVHLIIQSFNAAIIILTIVWLIRTLLRLASLASKGKSLAALRLAAGNAPMNLYFVFIVFMVLFFAITNNALRLSGRDWLPLIEPAFLLGFLYAPRAITNPRLRDTFSATVLTLLALYATVGSYYAALSVHERYYGAPYLPPLAALARNRESDIDIQRVFSAPVDNAIDAPINTESAVIQGDILHIAGWAADIDRRRAAGGVIALVDGNDEFSATYGYSSVPISEQLHNFLYYWSGYEFYIPTDNLNVGMHTVSFYIVSSNLKQYFTTPETVHFSVVPPSLSQPYQFAGGQRIVGSIDWLGSKVQYPARPEPRLVWLPKSDTLFVAGWALDLRHSATIKDAYGVVDGNARYMAHLKEPLPVLVRQFPAVPEFIAAYAGFSISIPVRHLQPGPHRLALLAVSGQMKHAVSLVPNFPFTTYARRRVPEIVHTEGAAWPVSFAEQRHIVGSIDQVTTLDHATDFSSLAGPAWLTTRNVMFLRGWALDVSHGRDLTDLWITIDGSHRYPVRPGAFRIDVPRSYPGLPEPVTYYSGFTVSIPMHQFHTGPHQMTLWGNDPVSGRKVVLVKYLSFTLF